MKCIKCGKETENYLCLECRTELRETFPKWEDYLQQVVWLVEMLNSPKKDYIIKCITLGNRTGVDKADREWLYNTFLDRDLSTYSTEECLKIKGWLLDALWQDYKYDQAEELASEIVLESDIPFSAILALADFYTRTRRYDAAASILKPAYQSYAFDEIKGPLVASRIDDNAKRYEGSFDGKGEYMPAPKDNKEEIRKKYIDFLNSIGIDAEYKKPAPKPIPKDDYPHLTVISAPNFDSFVAFDFETTGLSPARDTIIEIGAVKVINNKVSEAKNYLFSEFVKPFGSRITPEITRITGITPADVANARPVWEVIPDFIDFAEGLPLVGYNNASFDNGFLERAGRYSNIIIKNKTFDVLRYARSRKECFPANQKYTLVDIGKALEIANPKAHRAYADAITTAKVFLKLKEL